MDPVRNPFSPGAGAPPPELVGRSPLLEQARVVLGRVTKGDPEKSLLLTGLRGACGRPFASLMGVLATAETDTQRESNGTAERALLSAFGVAR